MMKVDPSMVISRERARTMLLGVLAATLAVCLASAVVPAAALQGRQHTVALPEAGQCTTDPHANKHELRAMWIASVVNIDWPSKPGLSAEQQKAELLSWYDLAVAQNHNAVVVQIRPTADAFWPSAYEPWSRYLTGTQGQDPGYDPLAFAVEQAHLRNLEFHAWFNPYRVSMDTKIENLSPDHPARQHPEWIESYGGKLYYNPGVPAAREFSINAIMDAVSGYDIDAVHFDDYFYPYPVAGQVFDDAAEYEAYGNGLSLADWRRDNINKLITGLQARIKAAKPWVKLGVSPFAIWRNASTDPEGSDTAGGVQTFDDLYADTRRWVQEEWIDYIAPQVYWSRGFAAADYELVTDWWADQVTDTQVQLFIGQATYKVDANADPNWEDPAELSDHLAFNTEHPQVQGNMFFSAKDVRADRLGATTLLTNDWYSHPALIPSAPQLDNRAPQTPRAVRVKVKADQTTLKWVRGSRDTASYAIYRVQGPSASSCDLADATHLVQTQRSTTGRQSWTDPTAEPGTDYAYLVTAVDRTGNESAAALGLR